MVAVVVSVVDDDIDEVDVEAVEAVVVMVVDDDIDEVDVEAVVNKVMVVDVGNAGLFVTIKFSTASLIFLIILIFSHPFQFAFSIPLRLGAALEFRS